MASVINSRCEEARQYQSALLLQNTAEFQCTLEENGHFGKKNPIQKEVDDKTSIGSPLRRENRVDGEKAGSLAPETPGIFL